MDYSEIFSTKEHIVFDFDQTIARILIDWSKWREAMFNVMVKYEPSFTFDQSINKNTNRMIEQYGDVFRQEFISANEKFELENYLGLEPNEELIEYIKNNCHQKNMYLYTSNSKGLIAKLLTRLNLTDCFKKVVTRDDVELIKPNPYGMNLLLGEDTDVSKWIMVGDSSSDRGVAENVGMDFLQVDM